jgi:hypothetical protein
VDLALLHGVLADGDGHRLLPARHQDDIRRRHTAACGVDQFCYGHCASAFARPAGSVDRHAEDLREPNIGSDCGRGVSALSVGIDRGLHHSRGRGVRFRTERREQRSGALRLPG